MSGPSPTHTCAALFGLLLLPGLSLAAVLVVDPGAPCPGLGTAAAPYCTLPTAVKVAKCGDIVRLRDRAPYTSAVILTAPTCEGKAPLVLEGDLYQEPVWRAGLTLQDVSNWVVRGLTFSGGRGTALLVHAKTRPTVGNQLLGNRVLDWALDPTQLAADVVKVTGSGGGLPVIGTVLRHNAILNYRGTGLRLSISQGALVEQNDLGFGACARRSETAGVVAGIKVDGWSVDGPVAAFGDVIRDNRIHDLEGREACRAELGVTSASVHGIYCDVGPSDLVVSRNMLWNIGTGVSLYETHAIRAEARCHRMQIVGNTVSDVGGVGLRVNGPNMDVLIADNVVRRAAGWCVDVQEGFTKPTRPGRRRRILRNQCLESAHTLQVSPQARAEDPGLRIEGNSWDTLP